MKILLSTALLALAVAACGGSGATTAPSSQPSDTPSAAPSAAPSAEPSAVASEAPSAALEGTPLIVKDFTLDPTTVMTAGTVTLAVTNEGPTLHNVAIRDDAGTVLGTTADLREGESEALTVELPAGTYTLFCSLPGHESLGIKGTLTVE